MFSAPSTMPVFSAVYTSPYGMGVGLACSASIRPTKRSDCCTRILSPFMSASERIGFFEV